MLFFRVATWFGVCSYRKLKVVVHKKPQLCPICQSELTRLMYFGNRDLAVDINCLNYDKDTFEDYYEGSDDFWAKALNMLPSPVWVEKIVKRKWRRE